VSTPSVGAQPQEKTGETPLAGRPRLHSVHMSRAERKDGGLGPPWTLS
jgi:hypothetical protein